MLEVIPASQLPAGLIIACSNLSLTAITLVPDSFINALSSPLPKKEEDEDTSNFNKRVKSYIYISLQYLYGIREGIMNEMTFNSSSIDALNISLHILTDSLNKADNKLHDWEEEEKKAKERIREGMGRLHSILESNP